MPIDPTPNLGLKKIDYGSAAWDADEHTNADKIDAAALGLTIQTPRYTKGVWDWGREWEYGTAVPTVTRPKVESASAHDFLGELIDFSPNPNPSAFYYATGPSIVGAVPYTPTVNTYAGVTFPAGKWITLGPGQYFWNAYAYTWFPLNTVIGGGSPGSVSLRHIDEYWDDPVQGGAVGSLGHPLMRQIDVLTHSDVIAGFEEFVITSQGIIVLPDLGPTKLHHLAMTNVAQKLTGAATVVLAGLTFIQT